MFSFLYLLFHTQLTTTPVWAKGHCLIRPTEPYRIIWKSKRCNSMATKMVAFCHLAKSRNSIHKSTEQNWSQREAQAESNPHWEWIWFSSSKVVPSNPTPEYTCFFLSQRGWLNYSLSSHSSRTSLLWETLSGGDCDECTVNVLVVRDPNVGLKRNRINSKKQLYCCEKIQMKHRSEIKTKSEN